MQDPRKEGEWQHCSDYSNGGPAFVPDEPASDGVDILAEYRRADNEGAAAVKCQVRQHSDQGASQQHFSTLVSTISTFAIGKLVCLTPFR